ncbi:MAG: hypothetical protein QXJ86_06775 [Nitrososphaerales archaeon]
MLRVYLSCTHVYEVGRLTEAEEASRTTLCPVCGKVAAIKKTAYLVHPSNSKRRWVEGLKQ